jgi:hypothetical protein
MTLDTLLFLDNDFFFFFFFFFFLYAITLFFVKGHEILFVARDYLARPSCCCDRRADLFRNALHSPSPRSLTAHRPFLWPWPDASDRAREIQRMAEFEERWWKRDEHD